MGSITNETDQLTVTFEVERLLDEPARMLIGGKFRKSSNILMRHIIGWVLWSLVSHKLPRFDPLTYETIQLSYDKDNHTFVAIMKKQH